MRQKSSLESFPPCYSQSSSIDGFFTPPPPPSKRGLKLVCNVNIACGNLKSDNSQDYAQKPQKYVHEFAVRYRFSVLLALHTSACSCLAFGPGEFCSEELIPLGVEGGGVLEVGGRGIGGGGGGGGYWTGVERQEFSRQRNCSRSQE
jgi:hypothetical protein